MRDVNETLENLRDSYQLASLDLGDCAPRGEAQFQKWFDEAMQARCDEPNAFVLSTVKGDQPRARVVLLKGIDQGQFIFYTNYESDKGQELQENQKVSMTFLWLPLQRQVRIEGFVSKISPEKSDDYFHKRPRGSQLGAIASPQSHPVPSRKQLEAMFTDAEGKYSQDEILPRPAHWGGYGITPQYFEFWQGRRNRMHDRISYMKSPSGWDLSRLAP